LSALNLAMRHGPPELADRCRDEIKAMWAERDAAEHKRWVRARVFIARDTKAMLNCLYRHPFVRGLTESECGKRRQCFLCAGPLPKRRQHWCSDRCVSLWFENHEWRQAANAALRRDGGCVRDLSHKGPFEVNHKVPRAGRGYHKGCHNHQKLLETLCHADHVIETVRQGRERRAKRLPMLVPPSG
jgi:hypothetical protein